MFGKKIILKLMLVVLTLVLLSSCKKEQSESFAYGNEADKENTIVKKSSIKDENSKPHTIGLPIKLDSSNYLVFPIQDINTNWKRSLKSSYEAESRYTGYYKNLVFQNIHTEKTHLLTNIQVRIKSYEQLYTTKREAEKIILYQLIDNFPKEKEALTYTSLYLGTTDGKIFQKISKENEQLTSLKYISETKKIYFKTLEDSNKDNELNQLDKEHIYTVSIQDFNVKEILKQYSNK